MSRREDLREECGRFWADADISGYGVSMLGSMDDTDDSLIIDGDERGDDEMLEAIGPGRLGIAAHLDRLSFAATPTRERASGPPLLTGRETQIAALLAEGLSNLNVAARLGIAEGTIAVHARNIYRKLGVHNRVDLVRSWLADAR